MCPPKRRLASDKFDLGQCHATVFRRQRTRVDQGSNEGAPSGNDSVSFEIFGLESIQQSL